MNGHRIVERQHLMLRAARELAAARMMNERLRDASWPKRRFAVRNILAKPTIFRHCLNRKIARRRSCKPSRRFCFRLKGKNRIYIQLRVFAVAQ